MPVTETTMEIGGNLKKSEKANLIKTLDNQGIPFSVKSFNEVLKGKVVSDEDVLGSSYAVALTQSGFLSVYIKEQDRLTDLEDFCKKHKLSFVTYSTRAGRDNTDCEFEDHSIYQWEPGFGEPQYIDVDFNWYERISERDIQQLLEAINSCRNPKKLPTLIHHDSEKVQTFAKELLSGKDMTNVIKQELSSLITKRIQLEKFKVV